MADWFPVYGFTSSTVSIHKMESLWEGGNVEIANTAVDNWIEGAANDTGDWFVITLDCLVSKVCCCVFYCTTNPITNIT
jgi:hypothetical protein